MTSPFLRLIYFRVSKREGLDMVWLEQQDGCSGFIPGLRVLAVRNQRFGATTVLRRVPTPSMNTSTTSPGRISPTPDGVPVMITSPG